MQVVSSSAGVNACPALAVEAVLSGKLDPGSLVNNFYVRQGGNKVPGQALVYNYGSSGTRLTFLPAALLAMDTDYEIVFKAGSNGLRSTTGGILSGSSLCSLPANGPATECAIKFTTIAATNSVALAACEPSSLTIEPPDPLFTCAGKNNCEGDARPAESGHQREFFARLAARNGQALHTLTDFTWASSEPTVMNLFGQNISATSLATVLPKEGQSSISAEVDVGAKKFKGSTIARVILCENPWPAYPGVPFTDQAEGGSTTMGNWANFSTYYCRDKGQAGPADDLPAMSFRVEIDSRGRDNFQSVQEQSPRHTPVPGLIKELFFTIPRSDAKNSDAIGIRVLQNPEHDAIAKWYSLQNFNQGSPQAAVVDGYKALRDGRTVYVAAPNDKDGDAGSSEPIYTNIYLISMSDNAQAGTQEIFNQLASNFRLNINIRQVENRQALQRDAARLVDLRNLADIVEARPAPPALNSGSYIQNLSTSVWPSWKGALSTDLGTALPVDPQNNIACPAAYDQATCYRRQPNPQFVCAAGSHIYQYQYSASPANFILKANLEYQGASWSHPAGGKWLSSNSDVCANVSYDSSR